MTLTCWSLRERLLLLFVCWVFCCFSKVLVGCGAMTQGVQLVRMRALNTYGNKVWHFYFCYFSLQWSTPGQCMGLGLVALAEVIDAMVPSLKKIEEFCNLSFVVGRWWAGWWDSGSLSPCQGVKWGTAMRRERKIKEPREKMSYRVLRIGWGRRTWSLNFKKGGRD